MKTTLVTTAATLAVHLNERLGIKINSMKVGNSFITFNCTIMGATENLVFCEGDDTLEVTKVVHKITSRNVKALTEA